MIEDIKILMKEIIEKKLVEKSVEFFNIWVSDYWYLFNYFFYVGEFLCVFDCELYGNLEVRGYEGLNIEVYLGF